MLLVVKFLFFLFLLQSVSTAPKEHDCSSPDVSEETAIEEKILHKSSDSSSEEEEEFNEYGRKSGQLAEEKCKEYMQIDTQHYFPEGDNLFPGTILIKRDLSHFTYVEHYKKIVKKHRMFTIIDGKSAYPKEFPHMAALGYDVNGEIKFFCGGSLISEHFVLTAAHCVYTRFGHVKVVRLGALKLSKNVGEDYHVIKRIKHPDYGAPEVYNDIALLKLDRKIEFNFYIKPACIYTKKGFYSGIELTATGWGITKHSNEMSDVLEEVELQLFPKEECVKDYIDDENTLKFPNGIDTATQFCAGSRNTEKDTCQGDSGGPLQYLLRNTTSKLYNIVGVISFGKDCGIRNIPGVYTRVSYYVPWIERIVWGEEEK